MKCLEFPPKLFEECNFAHPEHMRKLVDRLTADKITINCDMNTLEKLWYAFSEVYCAQFLILDDETYRDFLNWVKDIDTDTADHMDYYGTVTNSVHRPWDNDDREDDE